MRKTTVSSQTPTPHDMTSWNLPRIWQHVIKKKSTLHDDATRKRGRSGRQLGFSNTGKQRQSFEEAPVCGERNRSGIIRDLNAMEKRSSSKLVLIKGSVCSGQPFAVEMVPNYADHELVSGPRYQTQDVRINPLTYLGKNTCGLLLMAVNDGCRQIQHMGASNFLRKYEIKGKFGSASNTHMADGKIVIRTTFSHIRQEALDRVLASIQSTHQSLAYKYSGVDPQSQAAYELASKGLVRPCGKTDPIIYGIKCTDFNPPDFTLDVQCINENEEFFANLIHQIGIYVRSTAVCVSLRRTQFGHFTLDHALLRKHWTVENILNNITLSKRILNYSSVMPGSAHFEAVNVSKLKEIVEDMRQEAREDLL